MPHLWAGIRVTFCCLHYLIPKIGCFEEQWPDSSEIIYMPHCCFSFPGLISSPTHPDFAVENRGNAALLQAIIEADTIVVVIVQKA